MAVAGKVAITLSTENGGAWSADVTYDRLVAVKHNNNLYISRKTVVNVEPPNDEFWFLALEGFGGDDVQALIDRLNELSDLIQAIIDGTTQVGNAKTLDGHGAEYFAKETDLSDYLPIDGTAKVAEFLKSTHNNEFNFKGVSNQTEINFNFRDGETDDTGVTPLKRYRFYDKTKTKYVEIDLEEVTGGKKVLHTGNMASHVLPLSGGTVGTGNLRKPLNVKGTDDSVIGFFNTNGATLGSIGVHSNGKPIFQPASGVSSEILHTGNKPTGTYTGNGSADSRTISIGGVNASLLHVIDSAGGQEALVGAFGAIVWAYSDTTVKKLTQEQAKFNGVNLLMATDSDYLNVSGRAYTYHAY